MLGSTILQSQVIPLSATIKFTFILAVIVQESPESLPIMFAEGLILQFLL